jgi:hypothetical protein
MQWKIQPEEGNANERSISTTSIHKFRKDLISRVVVKQRKTKDLVKNEADIRYSYTMICIVYR